MSPDEPDAPRGAIEAFFAAMRTYPAPEPISVGWHDDERDGWIDDRVGRVVGALLAAGWSPPPSVQSAQSPTTGPDAAERCPSGAAETPTLSAAVDTPNSAEDAR